MDAHEGHEDYVSSHPEARVKRVGTRKWMSGEYGYDYTETLLNWHPSWSQIIGFLVTLVGLVAILLYLFSLGPHLPG